MDRIRKDPRCVELLGDGRQMTAFGEETYNKWRRARPIAWVALHPPPQFAFARSRLHSVMARVHANMHCVSSSTVTKDGQGNEHMMIQFNVSTGVYGRRVMMLMAAQVQGPKGIGRVSMHLVKRAGQGEYEYKYFFIDAKGHQRIYLENADAARAREKGGEQKGFKLFGVKWS